MPAVAVPLQTSRAIPSGSDAASVRPASSSTPGVSRRRRAAARRARRRGRGERVGVDIEQAAVADRRCSRRPARSRARRGPTRSAGGPAGTGTPTRPKSTAGPQAPRRCRRSLTGSTAHPRRSVRPSAPPAAVSAATRRVFTAPARTETTRSSVGPSVMRRPSTLPLEIPAAFSAASIARPPPCTITSGSAAASRWIVRRPHAGRRAAPRRVHRRI